MIVRVLFVDSDAGSLARIKGALEKAGDYEAVVFTTGEAALEDASQLPPTIAVVSLNVRDTTPATIVEGLRALRPEIPVLLRAPGAADQNLLDTLAPFDVLYGGYSARVLLPMIEDALSADLQPSPKPQAGPQGPVTNGHQVLRQTHEDDDITAFGEILDAIEPGPQTEEQDTFKTLVNSLRTPQDRPSMLNRRAGQEDWDNQPVLEDSAPGDSGPVPTGDDPLFAKLAAEEPPQPVLEDSGTVRDLIAAADPDLEAAAQTAAVDVPDEMIEDAQIRPLGSTEQDLLAALAAVSDEPDSNSESSASEDLVAMPEDVRQTLSAPVAADSEQAAALAVQLTQHTLAMSAAATMLLRDNRLVTWAGELSELDVRALAESVDCAAVLEGAKIKIRYAALRESRDSYMIVAAPTIEDMVLVMILDQNTQVSSIQQQAAVLTDALRETLEPAAPPAEPPAPPKNSQLRVVRHGNSRARRQRVLLPGRRRSGRGRPGRDRRARDRGRGRPAGRHRSRESFTGGRPRSAQIGPADRPGDAGQIRLRLDAARSGE